MCVCVSVCVLYLLSIYYVPGLGDAAVTEADIVQALRGMGGHMGKGLFKNIYIFY